MAQQAIWFNPRNLSVEHVPPSKSIVLIIAVSSDIPGQVLKSTTSPAHLYFCGIFRLVIRRYPVTLWDVKPRVEESSLETLSVDELITQLRQVCEDAEDRASNAQEEARQKRKEALEEVVQRIYRNNN
ncbi:hypothetical protein Tco_0706088 [Tanacetum coccineum]|uniref:Uncharacterized protein n=1 Tax=Tanacetum coccineum TaxID=301880 RepID=A0ABQ4Y7A5_9ASTR